MFCHTVKVIGTPVRVHSDSMTHNTESCESFLSVDRTTDSVLFFEKQESAHRSN
jgi:hypothetical protein